MSTYAEICKAECAHCEAGVDIDANPSSKGYRKHIFGWTDYSSFNVPNKWDTCAAPTRDQFIERLSADLTAAQERIRLLEETLKQLVFAQPPPCSCSEGSFIFGCTRCRLKPSIEQAKAVLAPKENL